MASKKLTVEAAFTSEQLTHETGVIEQAFHYLQGLAALIYNSTANVGAALNGLTVRGHYGDLKDFDSDKRSADLCKLIARTPRHPQSLAYINPFVASWPEALAAFVCAYKLHFETSADEIRARLTARRYAQMSDGKVLDAAATSATGDIAEARRSSLADYLTAVGFDVTQPTADEASRGVRPVWSYNGKLKAVTAKLAELSETPYPVGAVLVPKGDDDSGRGKNASRWVDLVCSKGCTDGPAKNKGAVGLRVRVTQLRKWKSSLPCCYVCGAQLADSKSVKAAPKASPKASPKGHTKSAKAKTVKAA